MTTSHSELSQLFEEAMRDAFKEGQAIIDEAVENAEARRRFQVDSRGCAVIAYAEEREADDTPEEGSSDDDTSF